MANSLRIELSEPAQESISMTDAENCEARLYFCASFGASLVASPSRPFRDVAVWISRNYEPIVR